MFVSVRRDRGRERDRDRRSSRRSRSRSHDRDWGRDRDRDRGRYSRSAALRWRDGAGTDDDGRRDLEDRMAQVMGFLQDPCRVSSLTIQRMHCLLLNWFV
jgi:hypothetical protein